jgi:hypothetical protein
MSRSTGCIVAVVHKNGHGKEIERPESRRDCNLGNSPSPALLVNSLVLLVSQSRYAADHHWLILRDEITLGL